MKMKIGAADCQNLERALSLEWLETNARGGFSSGTVAGANIRRYHALLLTARKPPSERLVLVNHLDEWVDVEGRSIPLSTNLYPGAVHPDGYKACAGFTADPWPTWTYDCAGAVIQREILCVQGRDLVIVRWRLLTNTTAVVTLRVRPMLSGRDYHSTHHENLGLDGACLESTQLVSWQPYHDLPAVRAFHSGGYRHEPQWFRQVQFPVERQRGLDHAEDWWSPGEFTYVLRAEEQATLAFTNESVAQLDIGAFIDKEEQRRAKLAGAAPTSDPLTHQLWLAAERYLSERGPRQTVIAGYPWFTDWGRDTFISLPGLCLATGRHEVAWQVIESFAAHVSEGMVPNRFPDGGEQPEYNTIDASLRPNQLYALSLTDDLVSKEQAASLLRIVETELLTPVGLRTLSPRDSRYRAHYEGGVIERDGAYHQGTVWPFLLGPFVTAWIKTHGEKAATLKQARAFLDGLTVHLGEACLGQVSEIFDAEAPHHPRGCVAQAWSVAEPLRALIEDLGVLADQRKQTRKRVVVRQRKETAPRPTQGKKYKKEARLNPKSFL